MFASMSNCAETLEQIGNKIDEQTHLQRKPLNLYIYLFLHLAPHSSPVLSLVFYDFSMFYHMYLHICSGNKPMASSKQCPESVHSIRDSY